MTEPCCPGHERLVDAEQLHREHAESMLRRQQWRALLDSGTENAADVASVLMTEDPVASATALKAEFGAEFKKADTFARIKRDHPAIAAGLLEPDPAVALAERVVRGGIALMMDWRQDTIALSAAQQEGWRASSAPMAVAADLVTMRSQLGRRHTLGANRDAFRLQGNLFSRGSPQPEPVALPAPGADDRVTSKSRRHRPTQRRGRRR